MGKLIKFLPQKAIDKHFPNSNVKAKPKKKRYLMGGPSNVIGYKVGLTSAPESKPFNFSCERKPKDYSLSSTINSIISSTAGV